MTLAPLPRGRLEFRAVSHSYGSLRALDSLDLAVTGGSIVGLLGPNGAGKSTAIRAALGVTSPTAGSVLWNGRPITDADRHRFGYMPEERGLYPAMKVRDQLEYFACLHGLTTAAAKEAVSVWLHRLAVQRHDARTDQLSLGNQQRVQLAAALLHDPDLLILDEPFSGLDPEAVDECGGILRECAERGVGILFSSHQLDLVQQYCDRVVILSAGRAVAEGTVTELVEPDPRQIELELDSSSNPSLALSGMAGVRVDRVRPAPYRTDQADTRWLVEARLSDVSLLSAFVARAAALGLVRRFGARQRHLSDVFRKAVATSRKRPEDPASGDGPLAEVTS